MLNKVDNKYYIINEKIDTIQIPTIANIHRNGKIKIINKLYIEVILSSLNYNLPFNEHITNQIENYKAIASCDALVKADKIRGFVDTYK